MISPTGASNLFFYDTPTGKNVLALDADDFKSNKKETLQEALLNERLRQFFQGITNYSWFELDDRDYILISNRGELWIYLPFFSERPICVYDGSLGPASGAQSSPNGRYLAFSIANDIYFLTLDADITRLTHKYTLIRLTDLGGDGIMAGSADYLSQEEMDQLKGFWWSPDSSMIAFSLVDESHIPQFSINHPGSSDPYAQELCRYCFAGAKNPIYRVGVVSISKPLDAYLFDLKPCWKKQQDDDLGYYIPRIDWWLDNTIMIQVQNRKQQELMLLKMVPFSSSYEIILSEVNSKYVNLHHMWKCFRLDGDSQTEFKFLWGSERNGFMQLYLYEYNMQSPSNRVNCLFDGRSVGSRRLAEFSGYIDDLVAVDHHHGWVYFTGYASSEQSTEKHFYRASLNDSETSWLQLTAESGFHDVFVDNKMQKAVVVTSSVLHPPMTSLYSLYPEWKFASLVHDASLNSINPIESTYNDALLSYQRNISLHSQFVVPQFHTIRSRDNKVDLHACLYVPNDGQYSPPYPAIVSVYGGPHVQRVVNTWATTVDMRAQALAQRGFVVLRIDNRGSARRGHDFESAIYKCFGDYEVEDQRTVVDYFIQIGLIDRRFVGIYGWSYGGYLTLMSLCKAPELFCCGVSGAPVTFWEGYDTHYTERYMDLPQENEEGYHNANILTWLDRLQGSLMLIHGLVDENVHFRHTAHAINGLISHRKIYQLMLFPEERHSPRLLKDRTFMEEQILDFFMTQCRNKMQ